MRARTIELMSYSELYNIAPQEIKDYIDRCENTPQGSFWRSDVIFTLLNC